MADGGAWDRRSSSRGNADADALFKAGKFEQAGRAYEEILRTDPANVHAARRRGHVALLSSRFADAGKCLKRAIELAPGDKDTHRLLADCYTRQDEFALAGPHWQAAGEKSYATLFAAFRGEPYQIRGDAARLRWSRMDPMPLVEVSLNGGRPVNLSFYTRVGSLNVSRKAAKDASLVAVTEDTLEYAGRTVTYWSGTLDSFTLGGIELRNLPVAWSDTENDADPGDGLIGTWVLYHFLTTIDYAGRSLILRRETPETAGHARALPLWLDQEHLLFSRGSVAGSGARVVALNIGGSSEMAASMTEETARRLRIRTDYDRPMETSAGGRLLTAYPCYPKEVRLGDAVAKDAYCYADKRSVPGREGFDVLANFSHGFYKPYHVTLDFTGMNVFIARGAAT